MMVINIVHVFCFISIISLQPQLLPPYLNAITSLIGSLPKGFGGLPQWLWGGMLSSNGVLHVKQRKFW